MRQPDLWTFRSRQTDFERSVPLDLYWAPNGDPISGNWTPEEISAVDLLQRWVERYFPDELGEKLYGPGMARIIWSVSGDTVFEGAPFSAARFR